MGRSTYARARASLLVAVVTVFGAMITGCGSGEESADAPPAETAAQEAPRGETVEATAPEETRGGEEAERTATVRLSGTEGTIYAGNYGNLDGLEYAEGIFEGEPVEFTVELRDSGFDVVNASFSKPAANDDGILRIEILSGGEVVAEQEAETQYGNLNLTWSSES